MVDFGQEAHLGRLHGVLVREEELQAEDAVLVGALLGALDGHVEVAEVVLVRLGGDTGYRVANEAFGLLRGG